MMQPCLPILILISTSVVASLMGCGGDGSGAEKTGASVSGALNVSTPIVGGERNEGGGAGGHAGAWTQGGTGGDSDGVGGTGRGGGGSGDSSGAGDGSGGKSGGGDGSGGKSGGLSGQGGGATNSTEPIACDAPDCCVPMRLDPSRVAVYEVGDSIVVNLTVQTTDPDDITSVWMPYADIVTSWGGTQICTTDRRRGAHVNFITLTCPAVVPSTKMDCGSPLAVQVRLRTDTHSDTQPFGVVCEGQSSRPLTTLTVPLQCPTCPPSGAGSYVPCDYPEPTIESNIVRCISFGQPCHCVADEMSGGMYWACAQP